MYIYLFPILISLQNGEIRAGGIHSYALQLDTAGARQVAHMTASRGRPAVLLLDHGASCRWL